MSPTPENPDKPPVWDEDRMWAELRARTIDAKPVSAIRKEVPARVPSGERSVIWRYAAILLLAVAGAAAVRIADLRSTGPASEVGHYSTSRGQYATIQLTDGSQAILAPLSQLTVAAAFQQGVREITLDGEAIFSVKHDAAHPFRVRANRALIEDVGTRFDVRAYKDEGRVTVAVIEGSVLLARDSTSLSAGARSVVRTGEIGFLDKTGGVATAPSARVANILGWADGRLSFSNQPLPEVLRTIGRWYDLDVRVPDARLAARAVTAEFSTQSPSDMLDALAVALDATVDHEGRVYTLRPR